MIRSPFFYVGDKYKLVPQLLSLFPKNINNYFEPFYGGGSSQLQVVAKEYYLNDIDKHIIGLHNCLLKYCYKPELFFKKILKIIREYNLSCSYVSNVVPKDLKKKFPKTYYSHYNKSGYDNLKSDYNSEGCRDYLKLYLLLIYGFNHMIRFNKSGLFNLPVGNVDFNKNVYEALNSFFNVQKGRKIKYSNKSYEKFLRSFTYGKNDFIYLDPPYYISGSEYNKLWTKQNETELYAYLDFLDKQGVKFGITNLAYHKGKKNDIFIEWSKKYKVYNINSNYISFNDNSIKKDSLELYVCNYDL